MTEPNADRVRDRVEDLFWERHSNPWSAGTRFLGTPALIYAIYRRDRRLLAATLVFLAVNPVLFPRPVRTDNRLSRYVLAEREWLNHGNETMSLDYPNVLNVLNIPMTLYAVGSALRRDPVGSVLGTLGVMGLKLWWVEAIVRRTGVTGEAPSEEITTES
ncbi:hypothetical protein C499_18819 [Halogeometricum borinquense DSM 11551]|uniref:Uncharacterized protein n=1 Tax=Halogeometricum borinquense (strain ATCC 700274 / DSM 11551 / JCM 10706 / KCTC 4070 / PR3) TaxID=469382 RepID=E4NNE7_HALBP|nr:DUF6653 family protein [Halogeometricum borinquense]ADQ67485.1 hypothetical protein Hbor_19180 [Halogeometricum borinquense DSM 11551]ELY23833.1 hypothetical protein C499_18819 [Halogeometricum borinquense DSM 11551]